MLSDLRRGKNTRHLLTGLLRQSVFGRLAGYEDVNDAERLSRDPAMRAIVDRKGLERSAASTSQMWRFETEWLATKENRVVLADLSGVWIDRVRLSASRRSIKVGAQARAVDQRRPKRHQLDTPILPQFPQQRGPAPAPCARLDVPENVVSGEVSSVRWRQTNLGMGIQGIYPRHLPG